MIRTKIYSKARRKLTNLYSIILTADTGSSWVIPEFQGRGYLQLNNLEGLTDKILRLEMWFLTKGLHGLLLYQGQGPKDRGDFISINLVNGYIQYRYDLGSGVASIKWVE